MPDFLTSTSAAIQAYTVPAGWNAAANQVEAVGPGGSGSARQNASTGGRGGGAGSYARRSDLGLAIGDVIYYRLPAGGAAVDSWFNDLNLLQATANNIGTSPWYLTNVSVTQSQSDPLGGSAATRITESVSGAAQHATGQDGGGNAAMGKTASVAVPFTGVCWLKANSASRQAQMIFYDSSGSNGAGCNIDLQAGNASAGSFTFGSGWTVNTFTVNSAGGGWYRVLFQATVNNAGTTIGYQVVMTDLSFTQNYAGDGSTSMDVYGANLTYGAVDKGFTATTSSAAYSVLAKAGTNATTGANGAGQSGSQGDATAQGGNGANQASGTGGGGGGAGGPNGAGGNASTTTGGSADGGTVAGAAAGNNGNSGTEFDMTHGCGSGAGGRSGSGNGFAGGAYGGGGSGCGTQSGASGGAGAQALIVITLDTSGGGAQPSRLLLLGVG